MGLVLTLVIGALALALLARMCGPNSKRMPFHQLQTRHDLDDWRKRYDRIPVELTCQQIAGRRNDAA